MPVFKGDFSRELLREGAEGSTVEDTIYFSCVGDILCVEVTEDTAVSIWSSPVPVRRPCLFKERDVKRAAKAVMSVGLEIGRVEIAKDGSIIVVPGRPDEPKVSPLDEWRSRGGSR